MAAAEYAPMPTALATPRAKSNDAATSSPPGTPKSWQSYEENGRLYHSFHRGIYMYPCDESEKNRMDMFHELFSVARRRDLHRARLEHPDGKGARILDLGCGTGIWAIDMADKFKEAEVIGVDLVNIQPEQIPPKLRFRIPVDYESHWTFGEDSWDLIHIRQGCGSVQSWPELYQKVFRHLIPGVGSIEHVEIDLKPRCDDGTLPQDVTDWYGFLEDATRRVSRPIEYHHNTRQMLETAGFIDIHEEVIRAPYNSWPRDPHQRDIGRWYCACLLEGLEALSLGPLSRVYNWPPRDIRNMVENVKKMVTSKKHHGYNNIHIWTARRPLG